MNMMVPSLLTFLWRSIEKTPSRSTRTQQGFVPEVATIEAILFPSAVEALGGNLPNGLTTEIWWSPSHPFKSSLSGKTAKELCDLRTTKTKKQWTPPIGYKYAAFEIIADVLKRAQTLDKAKIREAIAATK